MAGPADIPRLVKHMTLAIMRERGATSFKDAFQIARAQLTRYGYLARGSDEGPADNIKLTQKGRKRERDHARRPLRASIDFDRRYVAAFPAGDADRETSKDRAGGEPKEG